jgi:tetratricopeptide (TPR) repeat protein
MAKFYSTPRNLRLSDVKKPLRRSLSALTNDYHVCLEFRAGGGGKDYDVLLVHPKGIYLVEVKNEDRIIEGGLNIDNWLVTDARGDLAGSLGNPYNQLLEAVKNLHGYLRRNSQAIFPCDHKSTPCSAQQLCSYHAKFWYDIIIFPFLCVPRWNPKNQISPDVWYKLIQGSPAIIHPPFILDEIPKRNWDYDANKSYLQLNEDEISRLIKVLGLSEITLAQALGEPVVWAPRLDYKIVSRSSREAELGDLLSQLERDKVVVVAGEPKSGKSTLCQLLAADLHRSGIPIWDYDYRLAAHSGRFATVELLGAISSHLKAPQQQTLQDDIAAILAVLNLESGLLIIDNFETALDSSQTIADSALSHFIELLVNAREQLTSFVVITTTRQLRTQDGIRPPHYALPGISLSFALDYLTNEGRGWSTDEANRLYNIRPGNPHAMRLASSTIRDAVDKGFLFQDAYDQYAPDIVTQTYGISYNHFTPAERLLAEALALHPSGMSFDAVRFLLRRHDFHGNVLQLLLQMYSREAITQIGVRWFSILPQDRQYICERIEKPELLHRTAMEYYLSLCNRTDPVPDTSVEQIFTLAFFHALGAKEVHLAFDTFMTLRRTPTIFGFPNALSSMGRQLREHPQFEDLSASGRGQVLQFNGRLLRHLGDVEAARTTLERAHQMFEEACDPVWSASVLSDLGVTVRKQGDYGKELELYDKALNVLGDHNSVDALRARSSILGRKAQALQLNGTESKIVFDCYNDAIRYAREIDDRQLLVTRLGMLGAAYREIGQRDVEAAIKCYTEAIEISEATEGTPDIEAATAGLAKTYEKARRLPQALDLYLRAYELTKETDLFGMLDRLGTLGHVYFSLGKFDESEIYYERALELTRRLGNKKAEAENLDGFGSVHRTRALRATDPTLKERLLKMALDCHRRAVKIQEALEGDPSGRANRYSELGRTLFALNELTESHSCFLKAIVFARYAQKTHLEAWQFVRLGDVLDEVGQKENSYLCYIQATRLSPKEMAHNKGNADKAFRLLSSDSQRNVMIRSRNLDQEIRQILERKI